MARTLVAGIDSSTQQTKLVVVDAATGELVRSSALPHPEGTELNPEHWWSALHGAGATRPAGAAAISIAAQQHSTIFLDEAGSSVRDALLWNDSRAADSADQLRSELGDDAWLGGAGLLPDATHPISKLRWLAEHEPENAARVRSILLPHEWLTWRILHRSVPPVTDRSDASATGYWSPDSGTFQPDLVCHALGHDLQFPEIQQIQDLAGVARRGLLVATGCGDNAATHLALDTQPGDVVISVGTSTTVSMRTSAAVPDPRGHVDIMGDARGGFIPIVAMFNGARVLGATARLLGLPLERFDQLASEADPAAHGVVFTPFLDGERNPRAAHASGSISGLSRQAMTPATIARASYLGLACSIVHALDAVTELYGRPRRIYFVGGGARSATLRQAVSDLSGYATHWPEHREHAAFGAARQAAWVLTGAPPEWPALRTTELNPADDCEWVDEVLRSHEPQK